MFLCYIYWTNNFSINRIEPVRGRSANYTLHCLPELLSTGAIHPGEPSSSSSSSLEEEQFSWTFLLVITSIFLSIHLSLIRRTCSRWRLPCLIAFTPWSCLGFTFASAAVEWSTIIIAAAAVCTYAVEFHIVISDSPVAIAQLIGDRHCTETYGQSELHLLSYYYYYCRANYNAQYNFYTSPQSGTVYSL